MIQSSSRVKLLSTFLHFFPTAMVDSVTDNLQASRRFILLYNASTFCTKGHTSSNNNNIISKDGIISDSMDSKMGGSSSIGFAYEDADMFEQRQQFEIAAGLHRALLEGSLKVSHPYFLSAV